MCTNPKTGILEKFTKIDKKTGEIYQSSHLRLLTPDKINEITPLETNKITVPCGKCQQCRLSQASQKTTRAILEAQKWPINAFVTLTYDNTHLPDKRSLKKEDLQKFWKRLRKSLKNQKIRYLACGEYGPNTKRPHYHAIIFNYWPDDCITHSFNFEEDPLFTSKKLQKIWGKGFCIIAPVNYETCAYVSRYVIKKAFCQNETKNGQEPEFTTSSRRPGLGYIPKSAWENFNIILKNKTGTKIVSVPDIFREKMKKIDREKYNYLSQKNMENNKNKIREILKNTEINFFKYQKETTDKHERILNKLDKRLDL